MGNSEKEILVGSSACMLNCIWYESVVNFTSYGI